MKRNQVTTYTRNQSPLPPLIRGVSTAGRLGMVGGLMLAALILWGCGKAPEAPVVQQGTLVIQGMLPDGNPVDSLHVILDADTLGYRLNPVTLTNLWAGSHWVSMKTFHNYQNVTLEYLNIPHSVSIQHGQITTDLCNLTADIPISPYVGFRAPQLDTLDINSHSVNLAALHGRVVLLYFWSYT